MFILALCLCACASARMSDRQADELFREGRYEEAANHLEMGAKKEGENGRDLLLFLLDEGLALHLAGKYQESIKVFLRADKIAEIKDYTSLSTEAATLLTSDNIKDYKGEDFENVLISMYLALNYSLLGDTENALVECRRVHRKLELMITEGQRKYKQNGFARYLSGVLYEWDKNWNSAHVDYVKAHALEPDFKPIGKDLWRVASLISMNDKAEEYSEEFELTSEDKSEAKKVGPKSEFGELIVIYQNGISPIKRPNPDWHSIPKFYPRNNPVREAEIKINGEKVGVTTLLHDIEKTAIENLDEKYAGILAKKIGGVVAKEVAGKQVENLTGSPLLGFLTKAVLHATDEADVRSWNLLPRDLQIARFAVKPGTLTVQALPVGAAPLSEKVVQVQAGKKAFVTFRYMP